MRELRRVDLLWQGQETEQYEKLKADAAEAGMEVPEFVKEVLRKLVVESGMRSAQEPGA
jgi:hypothetical protein